jgi:hypothetical protein
MDMQGLWRLGLWGITAAVALAAAAWAAYSEFGAQRMASAVSKSLPSDARPMSPTVAQLLARSAETENETRRLAEAVRALSAERDRPGPTAAQLLARSAETENETRRLAEVVRTLRADRERLMARINTLERNLDEVTDSLAHVRAAAASPPPSNSAVASAGAAAITPVQPAPVTSPAPSPAAAASQPSSDAAWTAAVSRPPAAMLPSPAPWTPPTQTASTSANPHEIVTGSLPARTEVGVDLGGGSNIEALRALWTSIRGKHPALIDGLRPVVSIRDGARPGEVELRLVAGPLLNAATAARLCNSLSALGLACQPALFEGQRLALR